MKRYVESELSLTKRFRVFDCSNPLIEHFEGCMQILNYFNQNG